MCCLFSIGNGPRRCWPPTGAASQFPLNQYYCYWVPATKALWCDVHQSPLLHLINCTVHQSPVLHLARVLLQSPLLHLIKCAIHQSSQVRLLQVVHHSPISSIAPSTNVAPIITVAPYTVALFYSVAPFVSYHFVPCDYATHQFYIINNLATDLKLLIDNLIASLKSKFLQLQNML